MVASIANATGPTALGALIYHIYMWWTNARSKGEKWSWKKALRTFISWVLTVLGIGAGAHVGGGGALVAGILGTGGVDQLLKALTRYLKPYLHLLIEDVGKAETAVQDAESASSTSTDSGGSGNS